MTRKKKLDVGMKPIGEAVYADLKTKLTAHAATNGGKQSVADTIMTTACNNIGVAQELVDKLSPTQQRAALIWLTSLRISMVGRADEHHLFNSAQDGEDALTQHNATRLTLVKNEEP